MLQIFEYIYESAKWQTIKTVNLFEVKGRDNLGARKIHTVNTYYGSVRARARTRGALILRQTRARHSARCILCDSRRGRIKRVHGEQRSNW